ncbi:MAG: outer membrane protein assembly factor BamB [Burkholderiaceae bacterium]|nr:outer membrane protein assembly factor BamB [Burkholderiaceae bacterium]
MSRLSVDKVVPQSRFHWPRALGILAVVTALGGCSIWGGETKPKPQDLGANVAVLGVRQAWTAKLGATSGTPLSIDVHASTATLASADGVVAAINTKTGTDLWRTNLKEPLGAGVGSDGSLTSIVSRNNELIVLDAGREQWRQRLNAPAYTAPLVAGGRIFVLTADRSVIAFDAKTGQRLWAQQRPGEPLVLRQSGVLVALGNTLVVGISGKLIGFNPDNGTTRWEVSVSNARGTNDVERLVELIGHVSRVGESVCVRAFQSVVGCVDASRGALSWAQKSHGAEGVDGDGKFVYATESNGTVSAWGRADGKRAWTTDKLQYRKLTAPLLLGRSVVVGDDAGWIYFLSREDGSLLNRLATDGSGISVAPVVAADTLVAVTRAGNVYGFRPD